MKLTFSKLTLVLGVLVILVSPLAVFAQNRESIGISPATIDLKAKAGRTVNSEVRIINDGDEPLQYRLYAENFRVTNEDYNKDFSALSRGSLNPSSWFKLPGGNRTIAAHEIETVKYQIVVPGNAGIGSFQGVVFAETLPKPAGGTGVRAIKRVGELVYLAVGGQFRESGELLDFDVPLFQTKSTLNSTTRIKNSGNIHFVATGEVKVKSLFGKVVAKEEINGYIVPDTVRRFSLELPAHSSIGIYKVSGNVNFLGQDHELPGRWVVQISRFWMMFLGVGVGLIVLYAIISKLRPRRRR